MGCLTNEPTKGAWHRFGNVHLSGPCNRSCYFCIGQHMQALDSLNTLNTWPLPGWDDFIKELEKWEVKEVNLTGSNTEPLLFGYHKEYKEALKGYKLGIRTNGIGNHYRLKGYDMISVSIHSLNPEIYRLTMGCGNPPCLQSIAGISECKDLRINCVLGPENENPNHLFELIEECSKHGFKKINLREPYGQPHRGNPFRNIIQPYADLYGMPIYHIHNADVVYWDVHYVEVESVNLYANGRLSTDYAITRGHDPTGMVIPQNLWARSGRQFTQWNKTK